MIELLSAASNPISGSHKLPQTQKIVINGANSINSLNRNKLHKTTEKNSTQKLYNSQKLNEILKIALKAFGFALLFYLFFAKLIFIFRILAAVSISLNKRFSA